MTSEKIFVIILLETGGKNKLIKLDYTISSPEERNELVKKILEDNPEPNEKYLEILADYLVFAMEKEEKKEKKILTENRMTTVNKRETSFEGLVAQLENGEDGIYNLITNNKQIIFQPKVMITKQDLEDIPPLRELRNAIEIWEAKLKTAEGKDRFIIKKALIEMRKDQYIIKNSFRQPIVPNKITRSSHTIELNDDTCSFDEEGYPIFEGFSLMNPEVCEAVLCNYSKLKQESDGKFEGDTWYMIYDFEKLCEKALANYPLYMRLLEYKVDGM